ncbi:MAG: histone, partial [Thermoleophilaceae bacterium]
GARGRAEKLARQAIKDLRSAADTLEKRLDIGGVGSRSRAAKEAATTRKRAATKRSVAAKKAASTRKSGAKRTTTRKAGARKRATKRS